MLCLPWCCDAATPTSKSVVQQVLLGNLASIAFIVVFAYLKPISIIGWSLIFWVAASGFLLYVMIWKILRWADSYHYVHKLNNARALNIWTFHEICPIWLLHDILRTHLFIMPNITTYIVTQMLSNHLQVCI